MRALAAFLVAVNPAMVAACVRRREEPRTAAAAAALTLAAAVLAGWVSGPLLDGLDVTPATFRVAAGLVLGVASIRWLVVGARPVDETPEEADPAGWRRVVVPLLVPALLTPALVAVSISVGADDGVAAVAIRAAAAAVVAAAALGLRSGPTAVWSAVGRVTAALGVGVALAMVVDGLKTV